MDETIRIRLLSEQQAISWHGTITYEKSAFEMGTVQGELCMLPPHGYVVFSDAMRLMVEQERFVIPEHRIYEIHYDAP
jgi:hypothetical protein